MFLEKTGEKFDLDAYLQSRELCKEIVDRIANHVTVGMTEKDAQSIIKREFEKEEITKFWHPSKFRIGSDTLKTFRDLPDQNLQLSPGEIFFIDVGPIIGDHEADFGRTYVFESSDAKEYQALADAAVQVWNETADQWRSHKMSGAQLYDFADQAAQKLGYTLNHSMSGHRLGDFPHALFSKESLNKLDFSPRENLWVLEIHIRSEGLQRGAFFEDILTIS